MRLQSRIRSASLFEFTTIIVCFCPIFIFLQKSIDGDSAIYFTFIKNFFVLPFSFQPQTVSFGATSPLQVILFAPIFKIFGTYWLFICKALNFLILCLGIFLLNRAIGGNLRTLLLLIFLTMINVSVIVSVAQLFETGLVFFSVSLVFYLLKCQKYEAVIIIAGSLYLIRPELILITIMLNFYIYFKIKFNFRILLILIISALPILIFHSYMYCFTLEIFPSSILGRKITAFEDNHSWWENIKLTSTAFLGTYGIFYILAFIILTFLILTSKISTYKTELLFIFPIVILYTIYPPKLYIIRYLAPVSPILLVLMVQVLRNYFNYIKYTILIFTLVALSATAYGFRYYKKPSPDFESMLLKDLADQINPLTHTSGKILIYEIQSQFYISSTCYSLDGIVGRQAYNFLLKNESLEELILKNGVKYLVTMNSFNYRKIYDNTSLETIYLHDLKSNISDTIRINNIAYKKILSNKFFSDSKYYNEVETDNLNTGKTLRKYNNLFSNRANTSPSWNSVYEIIKY